MSDLATLQQLTYIVDHWVEEQRPEHTPCATVTWADAMRPRPNGAAHVVKASRRCRRILAESKARRPMDTLTALMTMYHGRLVRIARGQEDAVQAVYCQLAAHPPKTVEDGLRVAVCMIKRCLIDAHRHDVVVNRVLPLLAADEPPKDHTRAILAIRETVKALPTRYAQVLEQYLDNGTVDRAERMTLRRAKVALRAMLTA